MTASGCVTITMNGDRLACGHSRYYGSPMQRPRMTDRKRARMIRDAKRDYLAEFGIDWSQYDEPVIDGLDECPHSDGLVLAIFWHRNGVENASTGIKLSEVRWDEKTGEILQAGSNYGSLVF